MNPPVPYEISDLVNARILAVAEDKLQGFQRAPWQEIARLTGLDAALVMERIRAMLAAGTIRREGGPEFHIVNIMGVAHGLDKPLLLAHKEAIDRHLAACGIPVSYTNVFWGGRSEIKPSEIAPAAYRDWRRNMALKERPL